MKIINFIVISLLSIVVIVQFSTPVSSQTQDFDSLVSVLENLPNDSSKVTHLDALANTIMYQYPDSSFAFATEAVQLANLLGFKRGIAATHKTLGNISYLRGDYSSALRDYLASLEISMELGDSLMTANLYNNIGILYDEQGNIKEGTRYYQRALGIYKALGEFDGQATIYHNLGVMAISQNSIDSAINYLGKGLLINKELKDQRFDASAFGNLGYAFMEKAEYDTARIYFRHSLNLFKSMEDIDGVANQYLNMGELLQREGKYEESMTYLTLSAELAEEHQLKYYLTEDYELLSTAHEALGNPEKALEYYQKYKMMSDSIFTDEKNEALYNLQIKNEHDIAIAKINAERALEQERYETARAQNYMLIAITGLVLIVLLISAYYFMNRHRVTEQLREQNTEIMKQKKELDKQRRQVSEINRDLKVKNGKLAQLNKEKNYLMHVVAHDLKSPLNQMAGLVRLINLQPEKLSEEQTSYLEKIETVSTRLSHMVDKILDIEAIERKSYNLVFEEVDLRDILHETINEFKPVAREKNIELQPNINGKISLVKLDKQHAIQVFNNLLSNAIKFSPPNKKIEVKIGTENNEIITEIVDEGPGLTNEDKERVFKKFQKLSAKPTGDEESSGLGLSIVKKYVEAMNGKVWVESTFGKGANFKVAFHKAGM